MKNLQPSLLYFICLLGIIPIAESAQPYAISTDGTEVTIKKTGQIWRRCAEGMQWDGKTCAGNATSFTYKDAMQFAATQASSTGLAWRLPNMVELTSIIDTRHTHPAINRKIFPATPAASFWVASPELNQFLFGWHVNFDDGYSYYNFAGSNTFHVRLVRNSQ